MSTAIHRMVEACRAGNYPAAMAFGYKEKPNFTVFPPPLRKRSSNMPCALRSNGSVLIYLLLADRDVEIVADRGIHAKVGLEEWEKICRTMETAFKQADYEGGMVSGIQAVNEARLHYTGKDKRLIRPDPQIVFAYDVSNLENGQLAK